MDWQAESSRMGKRKTNLERCKEGLYLMEDGFPLYSSGRGLQRRGQDNPEREARSILPGQSEVAT